MKDLYSRVGCAACLCMAAGPALALNAGDVLVVYNTNSAEGTAIFDYYQQAHPGVQGLGLDLAPEASGEQIEATTYLNTIRPVILNALTPQIDCIVTTKGMPLRIYNDGCANAYSSLESELARIDTIDSLALMANQAWDMPPFFGGNPLAANPYYDAGEAFSHAEYGTRLTARLDAFTVQDVTDSIDRAGKAVWDRPGLAVLLDDDPNAPACGIDRMEAAQTVLAGSGLCCQYECTDAFVAEACVPGSDPPLTSRLMGYVGHGRHGGAPEGYLVDSDAGLRCPAAPGAVFHAYESYNAYSFEPGGNRYGQALVAEWLQRGGTAGLGDVEEPQVEWDRIAREDIVFQMLLDGYTWAEASAAAVRMLSHTTVAVGDPLMTWGAWQPGDYNRDGDTDTYDLMWVKVAFGTEVGDEGYDFWADMNADGDVDAWDYAFAKWNYTGTQAAAPPGAPIPEPHALALLLAGGLAVLRRRR